MGAFWIGPGPWAIHDGPTVVVSAIIVLEMAVINTPNKTIRLFETVDARSEPVLSIDFVISSHRFRAQQAANLNEH